MAEVELVGVAKAFGQTSVLRATDLTIRDGEFMVFVGPSGCGKSTLLRMIAGLEPVSAGRVRIGGADMTERAPGDRGIAMVFQSYALYPHLSVYENMAFALRLAKVERAEIDRRVRAAAETLNVAALLDRKPRALSGGQRQRVAIGRAIVREPDVFLFDEPLSNLDAALRVRMRYEFARLHQALGTTMIYVTHDQVEAMTLADRIVVLSAGRIEQVGTPMELYEHPDTLFVAGFIGSPKINLIAVTILSAGAKEATVRLPSGDAMRVAVDASGARAGDIATLGLRPEHLEMGRGDNGFAAEVRFVEALGALTFAYVAMAGRDAPLTVQLSGQVRLRTGDALRLEAPAAAGYLFAADGTAYRRLQAPGVRAAA